MRWFSFFFPEIALELRKILAILNPITKKMKTEFSKEEAVNLLKATAEALVALKAEAKAASDALAPLAEDNAKLQSVVDTLVEADKAVDAELGKLAEILSPAEPVEPEPVIEPAPEPVVEPTE